MYYTVIDARYVRDYVVWVKFEDGTFGHGSLSGVSQHQISPEGAGVGT